MSESVLAAMRRFAVLGPGRVGGALARRWREAGMPLLGFCGGRLASVARAIEFCAGGEVFAELGDLAVAELVLVAVPDAVLPELAKAAAAAGAARPEALWLHCSGYHSLEVLQPLVEHCGIRVGSLHPACPFPDLDRGYAGMAGKPGVLAGTEDDRAELTALAERAALRPVWMPAADRIGYHAACALAANGLTALHDLVVERFRSSCELESSDAAALADALFAGALAACVVSGARDALSGPVVRGDLAVVEAHLGALRGAPLAASVYRSLMRRAADLAAARGLLTDADLAAFDRLLVTHG